MSMILPKGIIVNSVHINPSIEQLDAQPVGEAEIARLWKVYTTTQRRLRDPTAERLENLWWRIWGSRGKELRGAIVARLFGEISDGETFVPLRGPPNRDEGPPLTTRKRLGNGTSSTTTLEQQEQAQQGSENSPSSRSQAPMPHPILKKTRGPSSSGPRPTARFISPHDTEDETSPPTSESTNTHVVVEPPSPQDPQSPTSETRSTAVVGKKKGGFIASTAKKRRPVIVKRQTSQSSNESVVRNSSSAQFSAIQSSSERTPPSFTAPSRNRPQSRFQENFSPSSGQSFTTARSPKNRGGSRTTSSKSPRKSTSGSRKPKTSPNEVDLSTALSGDPGPSTSLRRVENQHEIVAEPESLTEEELHELEVQRVLLEQANARIERQNQRARQLIQEAQTDAIAKQLRQPSHDSSDALSLLNHESKSKSTVSMAPTLTAPTGQLDLRDIGDPTPNGLRLASRSASMGRLDKGKDRDPEELRRTAMFAKRSVPSAHTEEVQPPEPPSTLSRSKSQLTLLLEKDRARGGDKDSKSPKNKGADRNRK